jgi:hypothetical protein
MLPPEPADRATPIELTLYCITFYEREFARADEVVKKLNRALWGLVVVGAIALVGASIAWPDAQWPGCAAIGLAAPFAVIVNGREVWVGRSVALGQIQAVEREIEIQSAAGEDPTALAQDGVRRLNAILSNNLATWAKNHHEAFAELYEPRPTPHSPGTGTARGHRADGEQPRPRRGGPKARRAAGSRTSVDVLRAWAGHGRKSQADFADLATGRVLLVSALLREKRWRRGRLVLDLSGQASPIVWSPWPRGPRRIDLSSAVIDQVHPVLGNAWFEPGWPFQIVEVHAADGHHRLAIPWTDIPLVQAALEGAASQPHHA